MGQLRAYYTKEEKDAALLGFIWEIKKAQNEGSDFDQLAIIMKYSTYLDAKQDNKLKTQILEGLEKTHNVLDKRLKEGDITFEEYMSKQLEIKDILKAHQSRYENMTAQNPSTALLNKVELDIIKVRLERLHQDIVADPKKIEKKEYDEQLNEMREKIKTLEQKEDTKNSLLYKIDRMKSMGTAVELKDSKAAIELKDSKAEKPDTTPRKSFK